MSITQADFADTEQSAAHLTQSPESEIAWIDMRYQGLPCFSLPLIRSLRSVQRQIAQPRPVDQTSLRYVVLHSSTYAETFGIGGDLGYFLDCIESGDRAALAAYADACVDVLDENSRTDYMTIALVDGDCLGGAFETALSCDLLVAERHAKFGFPEIMFGMFPGMGGLSYLSRRINPGQARRMLQEARTYTAVELHDLGVVDVLAEPGEGARAIDRFMRQNSSRGTGIQGISRLMKTLYPVTRGELEKTTRAWVDVAFRISASNRNLMRRLVKSQSARWIPQPLDRPREFAKTPNAS